MFNKELPLNNHELRLYKSQRNNRKCRSRGWILIICYDWCFLGPGYYFSEVYTKRNNERYIDFMKLPVGGNKRISSLLEAIVFGFINFSHFIIDFLRFRFG